MNKFTIAIVMIILFFTANSVFSQVSNCPAKPAAALALKTVGFNTSLPDNVTIYVLGSSELADELRKNIGKALGNSKLAKVESGDDLPGSKPSILFIASTSKAKQAIAYCKNNKIMSVTNIPNLVASGVSIGYGVNKEGKSAILLNLTATSQEDGSWSPALVKISEIIK